MKGCLVTHGVASDDSYKFRARVWGWEVSAAEVVSEQKRANQRLALNLVWAVSSMGTRSSMEEAEVAGSMIFGDGGGLAGERGDIALEGTKLSRENHCSSMSTGDIGLFVCC